MNTIQSLFCIAITSVSSLSLGAGNHSHAMWPMIASRCDTAVVRDFDGLIIEDFLVTNEQGENIYQIALAQHKKTGSIPCAIMAVSLKKKVRELHADLVDKVKQLDGVERTFETPHQ